MYGFKRITGGRWLARVALGLTPVGVVVYFVVRPPWSQVLVAVLVLSAMLVLGLLLYSSGRARLLQVMPQMQEMAQESREKQRKHYEERRRRYITNPEALRNEHWNEWYGPRPPG